MKGTLTTITLGKKKIILPTSELVKIVNDALDKHNIEQDKKEMCK